MKECEGKFLNYLKKRLHFKALRWKDKHTINSRRELLWLNEPDALTSKQKIENLEDKVAHRKMHDYEVFEIIEQVLSKTELEALVATVLLDLTDRETADTLGVCRSTISKARRRAIEKLNNWWRLYHG